MKSIVERLRACEVDRHDPDVLGIESLMQSAAVEIERLERLCELKTREANRLRDIQASFDADWAALRAEHARAIEDRDAARVALRGIALSMRSQADATLELLGK